MGKQKAEPASTGHDRTFHAPAAEPVRAAQSPEPRREPSTSSAAARMLARRVGDQHARRILAPSDSGGPVRAGQAKLAVNVPGDAYEREADRAADAVMRGVPVGSGGRGDGAVLRRCACGGTCAACRGDEEAEPLRREADGSGASPGFAPPVVHDVLASAGRPLEAGTRAFMERGFGVDFGGVRVHADGPAAESARAVNAHAYTVGSHVAFAAGQYAPGTHEGDRLIAHELAHTLQQGSGEASGVQRVTAAERIDRHTSWGNLDEEALGAELAGLLPGGTGDVQSVIDKLGSSDRDDVALAVVASASDDTLRACDPGFLAMLRGHLAGGYTADAETRAIGRLKQIEGGISGVKQVPATTGTLSGTSAEIVARFTSWGNLDEEGLGRALATRSVAAPVLITGVLDALGSTDRDDVAEVLVNSLSDTNLYGCSLALLKRLRAELGGGWTADTEHEAVGRLDAAIGTKEGFTAKINAADATIAKGAGADFGESAAALTEKKLLEHRLAVLEGGHGTYVGNRAGDTGQSLVPPPKPSDCTEFTVEILRSTFEKRGEGKKWKEIVGAANKASGGKMKGTELMRQFQTQLGWTGLYWNPDSSSIPKKKDKAGNLVDDTEHKYSADVAKTKGTYYSLPVDKEKLVIDYRPKDPAKTPNTAVLAKLRKIRFALLTPRGGKHVALLINGIVYELHWEAVCTSPDVITATPLEQWKWLSGLIVAPPGDVERAWSTP